MFHLLKNALLISVSVNYQYAEQPQIGNDRINNYCTFRVQSTTLLNKKYAVPNENGVTHMYSNDNKHLE
jgi:hypothetical protein